VSWLRERWIAERTARSAPIETQLALARDYQVAGWRLEKGRQRAQGAREVSIDTKDDECSRDFSRAAAPSRSAIANLTTLR
jgi:hypothetical protein